MTTKVVEKDGALVAVKIDRKGSILLLDGEKEELVVGLTVSAPSQLTDLSEAARQMTIPAPRHALRALGALLYKDVNVRITIEPR